MRVGGFQSRRFLPLSSFFVMLSSYYYLFLGEFRSSIQSRKEWTDQWINRWYRNDHSSYLLPSPSFPLEQLFPGLLSSCPQQGCSAFCFCLCLWVALFPLPFLSCPIDSNVSSSLPPVCVSVLALWLFASSAVPLWLFARSLWGDPPLKASSPLRPENYHTRV